MTAAGARVAAFGVLLVAVFGLAALAGRAIDPVADPDAPAAAPAHGSAPEAHGDERLRLAAGDTTLPPGRPARLDFAVIDERGARVREFEVEQGRRMHLIVVRRDLRRFQHLHPTQDDSSAWSVRLTLPDAGVYHAFADFQVAGERRTLGTDLFVPGGFRPRALPAPATTASTGRYDVALHEHDGELRFEVTRGRVPVDDLQPYLGARGHLVMLRAGDLAYEHVHPLAADTLAFHADAAPGTYRLFLQFRHAGRVHTVAFTREVRR